MSNHIHTPLIRWSALMAVLLLCSVATTGCDSEADRVIEQALEMEEDGNPEEAYDYVRTTLDEAEWGTFSAEEEQELRRLMNHLERQFDRSIELDLDATSDPPREHEVVDEGESSPLENLEADTEILGLDDWEASDTETGDTATPPDNIEVEFDDDAVEIPDELREQLEEIEVELQDE